MPPPHSPMGDLRYPPGVLGYNPYSPMGVPGHPP